MNELDKITELFNSGNEILALELCEGIGIDKVDFLFNHIQKQTRQYSPKSIIIHNSELRIYLNYKKIIIWIGEGGYIQELYNDKIYESVLKMMIKKLIELDDN